MLVECPICQASVAENNINSHMDGCLKPKVSGSVKQTTFPLKDSDHNKRVAEYPRPKLSVDSSTEANSEKEAKKRKRDNLLPLAEKARPKTFSDLKGQASVSLESDLYLAMKSGKLFNIIFYGPPGSGKTSIARLIGESSNLYLEFSATIHNLLDIRRGLERALSFFKTSGTRAVIFIDELHRLSKAQQDVFLQVEKGSYVLIAATTENPSFRINNALISRSRVLVFDKLDRKCILEILENSLQLLENKEISISSEVLNCIAVFADGDARIALNALEQVYNGCLMSKAPLTVESVGNSLGGRTILFDRNNEEHYNSISALHKSMRGSDRDASLYWLGRMIYAGQDPLYVARRLVRFASEDIGIADSAALPLAMSTYQACQVIGMPECDVILAHCVTYLADAPKNVDVYRAIKKVKDAISKEPNYPVPLHLRNAPTALNLEMGYSVGYKYNPDFEGPIEQTYFPTEFAGRTFF